MASHWPQPPSVQGLLVPSHTEQGSSMYQQHVVEKAVCEAGHQRHCSFCLPFFLGSLSLGEEAAMLWGHSRALWRGPRGQKLRPPANSANLPAMWLSRLKISSFSSCRSSDNCGLNQHISYNLMRPWTRISQLSHFQILNLQKLGKKIIVCCVKLLSFGVVRYTAEGNVGRVTPIWQMTKQMQRCQGFASKWQSRKIRPPSVS